MFDLCECVFLSNRLWKEKCRECGIDESILKSLLRHRPSGAIVSNPWKLVNTLHALKGSSVCWL